MSESHRDLLQQSRTARRGGAVARGRVEAVRTAEELRYAVNEILLRHRPAAKEAAALLARCGPQPAGFTAAKTHLQIRRRLSADDTRAASLADRMRYLRARLISMGAGGVPGTPPDEHWRPLSAAPAAPPPAAAPAPLSASSAVLDKSAEWQRDAVTFLQTMRDIAPPTQSREALATPSPRARRHDGAAGSVSGPAPAFDGQLFRSLQPPRGADAVAAAAHVPLPPSTAPQSVSVLSGSPLRQLCAEWPAPHASKQSNVTTGSEDRAGWLNCTVAVVGAGHRSRSLSVDVRVDGAFTADRARNNLVKFIANKTGEPLVASRYRLCLAPADDSSDASAAEELPADVPLNAQEVVRQRSAGSSRMLLLLTAR